MFKRFVFCIIAIMVVFFAHAETITLKWLNEGGTSVSTTTTCESGGDLTLPQTPTKYGYTFIGWKFTEYIPIEYLESTGTQYIDTGIIPSYSKTKVEMEIFTAVTTDTSNLMFGCGDRFRGNRFFVQTEQSKYSIGIGKTYEITSVGIGRVNITFSPNGSNSYNVTINSNTIYTYQTESAGTPIDSIKVLQTSGTRIYFLKIYDNGVLVRDFVPALDGNGTPCMYDKVSKQYFYNQGTGNFIAGPVISEQ